MISSKRSVTLLALAAIAAAIACIIWWVFLASDVDVPRNRELDLNPAGTTDTALDPDTDSRDAGTAADRRSEIAAAPQVDAKVAGRLRVRVEWHDGKAAPNVGVRCRGPYPKRLPGGTRLAISDQDGVAIFDGLPATKVSLRSQRGGSAEALVDADRESEVTLKIPRGVDVVGVVVDSRRAVVRDAAIWMTTGLRNWLGGRVVTRSDDAGTFRIRSMPKAQSIGAFARGHARSRLVDLDTLDTSQSPVRVRIVLEDGGGSAAIRVVDRGQRPIPNATVAIGALPRRFKQRSGFASVEEWTARVVACDEDGRAIVHGLPPGEHALSARASGYPIVTDTLQVVRHVQTEAIVVLAEPVVVHGVARDAADKPVVDAIVRAIPEDFDQVFAQSGQFDFDAVLGYPMTTTDEHGRYRLETVAPGEIHLHAQVGRKRSVSAVLFRTQKKLYAEAGATIEWNPRLEAGHTIRGSVAYRSGEPMPNLFITAKEQKSGKRNVITSDAKGHFRFVNLNPVAYSVHVQLWSPPEGSTPLERTDVYPDQGELRFVASYDAPVKLEPGTVRGRIQDASKRIRNKSALLVMLVSSERYWNTDREIEDGKFEFRRVKPGKYKIAVKCAETLVYVGDWFEVVPGQTLDLGVLWTQAAGSLVVRLKRGPDTLAVEPSISLRPPDSIHATRLEPGTSSEFRSDNITASTYAVRLFGKGVRTQTREIRVGVGSVTELEFDLQVGVLAKFHVGVPTSARSGSVQLEVTDAATGEKVLERSKELSSLPRPWSVWFTLPIGEFLVRAKTSTGLEGQTRATVTLGGTPPVVHLHVR